MKETVTKRTCKKCNKEKELEQFCDTVTLSKSYDCKECRNEYTANYYRRNKEKISEYNKQYAAKNRAQITTNQNKRRNEKSI